jgi:hypothetical protein
MGRILRIVNARIGGTLGRLARRCNSQIG